MRKMNSIAVIASSVFLFSSITAISGPYNIPVAGSQFTPHLAQPVLKLRPTISHSTGHVKAKKKAARKRTRRIHTSVPKVILKPAAQKRFRSGVQVYRHVAAPAVGDRAGGTGNGGFAPRTGLPTENVQANQAKGIGEAGARMKQVRELQRMRDLGSPIDPARRRVNGNGRQDCSRSPNRAACLRNNMNAGQKPNLPNGNARRAMQACLQAGGNVASCRQGGGQSHSGRITAGPAGDPRNQIKDPRGVAAVRVGNYDTGEVKEWTPWQQYHNTDNSVSRERNGYNGRGEAVEELVVTKDDGTSQHTVRVHHRDGSLTTHSLDRDALDRPGRSVHTEDVPPPSEDDPDSQAAPDSASGGLADNCNWNPALGKCMKPRLSGIGMTSQPGPDGKNSGAKPGRTSIAPDVGLAGTINCGDANSDACNRGGFGLSSGARRLDMKDTGPGVPKNRIKRGP